MHKPYTALQEEAFEANRQLPQLGLVLFTFGNASAVDRAAGCFAIKPSGVAYDKLQASDMVVCDLEGERIHGDLRPSSDTATHAALYRAWDEIGGVVHTHSTYATAWAQSRLDLPILGTTHADHLAVDVPCARVLAKADIETDYERNTGAQIVDCLAERRLDYRATGMILVAGHGPFTWGATVAEAVYRSAVCEELAKLAFLTRTINPQGPTLEAALIHKHFARKHGADAYYGQENNDR